MRYPVEVRLARPAGRERLDALQQVGAESLLRLNLWQLMTTEGLAGSDHAPLAITDLHVCTKDGGAHVVLPLDVGGLARAEKLARAMIRHTLAASVLLADWRIVHCGVKLDESALGLPAPESDCTSSPLSMDPPPAPPPRPSAEVLRERMLRTARTPGPFPPSAFGHDPAEPGSVPTESAAIAAGMLYDTAYRATTHALRDTRAVGASRLTEVAGLGVLGMLPPAYRSRYDEPFANWMLVAVIDMAGRLGHTSWTPPESLAEALALHIIIATAHGRLLHDELLGEEDAKAAYEALRRHAFTDDDHERLYHTTGVPDADPVWEHLDVAPSGMIGWFAPGPHGHPFFRGLLGERSTVFDGVEDDAGERLRSELGVDPQHLFTVLDLAAVGVVEGTWQATAPALQPEAPIGKGDAWRVLCYHRHEAQRRLRRWCAGLGLTEDSTLADLAALPDADPAEPLREFGRWLTDRTRVLPSGHTVGELTGGSHGMFCDIVAHNVSTVTGYVRDRGAAEGLLVPALRGGLPERNRFGTPGWRSTVDLVAPMLAEPNHPDWGPHAAEHGGVAALLPAYVEAEFSAVRDLLTARPWRIDSATADCVVTALLAKLAATPRTRPI